jgi:hypothetical protein
MQEAAMDQNFFLGLALTMGLLALIGAFIALLMGLRWLAFRIFPAALVGPGGVLYDTTTRLGVFNQTPLSHLHDQGSALGSVPNSDGCRD